MTAYFIDPIGGSNSNAGTSAGAPIQTPYKSGFLAGLTSGDVVRFKRGTTLLCSARIDGNVSGVTYRAYYNSDGSDDRSMPRPIIDGNGVRQIWGMATDRTGIHFYDLDFTNWGDGLGVDSFAIANATTGNSNSIVTSVRIEDCSFYDSNPGTADVTAIHLFGADCVLKRVRFWGMADDAIWVKGDNLEIAFAQVYDINGSGRNTGDCIQLGGRSDNYYVHDCYLNGSAGVGKQCFIISGASAGTGGVFENNYCIGGNNEQTCAYSDQPGSAIRGNRFKNGKYAVRVGAVCEITDNICECDFPQDTGIYLEVAGCTVESNTVVWTGAAVGGTAGTASGIYTEAGEVSTLRNNILSGCGRGIRLDESVATESYNVFFGCTVAVKGISTDPPLGTGSQIVDPQMRDDFMPISPAVRSAGANVGGTDFYGMTRPSSPTIGAVQYQAAIAAPALPAFLYDNRLTDGTPAASTTEVDFDVLNLTDLRPYSFWKPTALPATITIDCGDTAAADFAAIYRHDLGTCGCVVEIRGSTDNFAASDDLLIRRSPSTDDPLILPFASSEYRYWRITIDGFDIPTLAIALIGEALRLPRRQVLGFDPVARSARTMTNQSAGGYPLGKVTAFEEWRQKVALDVVQWAWLRDTWLPAWREHLRDEPFLYAWDSTDHPTELYLVTSSGEFAAPTLGGDKCSFEVEISGAVP